MIDADKKIGEVGRRLQKLSAFHHKSKKLHPARFHYQEVLDILQEMKGTLPIFFGGPDRRGIDPKLLKLMDGYFDVMKEWADKWIGTYGCHLILYQGLGETAND